MARKVTVPPGGEGLIIRQPRNGYRFTMDALLLAAHVEPGNQDRVLELGAGCGVVSLILALGYPTVEFLGVELQAELARLARENVLANGLENRMTMLQKDMRVLSKQKCGGGFDWVISNPPYRRCVAGRINPHPQKAMARHEIAITLKELVATARRLLRPQGRLVFIYSSDRLAELLACLTEAGLAPKWLRCIHPRWNTPARLLLVGARKDGRPGLAIRPPLTIYSSSGNYSPEAAAIFKATTGWDVAL